MAVTKDDETRQILCQRRQRYGTAHAIVGFVSLLVGAGTGLIILTLPTLAVEPYASIGIGCAVLVSILETFTICLPHTAKWCSIILFLLCFLAVTVLVAAQIFLIVFGYKGMIILQSLNSKKISTIIRNSIFLLVMNILLSIFGIVDLVIAACHLCINNTESHHSKNDPQDTEKKEKSIYIV